MALDFPPSGLTAPVVNSNSYGSANNTPCNVPVIHPAIAHDNLRYGRNHALLYTSIQLGTLARLCSIQANGYNVYTYAGPYPGVLDLRCVSIGVGVGLGFGLGWELG